LQAGQSYATLPAFDTAHPAIVAGLLGTAMAAAALTRFVAHRPQRLLEGPMSTRQGAMGAMHVFGDRVEALQRGDGAGLSAALAAAITSLACQARPAHPKRDRHTGRSQRGLAPFFAYDDMIEFVEAASVLTYE